MPHENPPRTGEATVGFVVPLALAAILAAVAVVRQGAEAVTEDPLPAHRRAPAGSTIETGRGEVWYIAPPRVGEAALLASYPPGSTWDVEVRGGFVAELAPSRPLVSPEPHVAYAFDFSIRRHVESNDGERVRMILEFRQGAAVKLLTEAQPLVLADLADRARPLRFSELDALAAGEWAVIPAEQIAAAILADGADRVARSRASRGFLQRDALAGNRVAMVYRDGVGIEAITPLDASIAEDDLFFLLWFGLVGDAALRAPPDVEQPASWSRDASLLTGLLGPSLRGRPMGPVRLSELPDNEQAVGGAPRALRISPMTGREKGAGRYPGAFVPDGTIHFAPDEPWIAAADISWTMLPQQRGHDSMLFESQWIDPPQVLVHYRCARACTSAP